MNVPVIVRVTVPAIIKEISRPLPTAGEVELKVPKLKGVPFETAIIERYRRREASVEEALIEMYLAGVSVRRVEDITQALWGTKVSPGTISNLNKKAYEHIDNINYYTLGSMKTAMTETDAHLRTRLRTLSGNSGKYRRRGNGGCRGLG